MAETDDFLSGIGLSEADIAQPTNVYERFILALANKIKDDLRETVNAKARNSGMLAASVFPFLLAISALRYRLMTIITLLMRESILLARVYMILLILLNFLRSVEIMQLPSSNGRACQWSKPMQ
jgi:hypothetical protein